MYEPVLSMMGRSMSWWVSAGDPLWATRAAGTAETFFIDQKAASNPEFPVRLKRQPAVQIAPGRLKRQIAPLNTL